MLTTTAVWLVGTFPGCGLCIFFYVNLTDCDQPQLLAEDDVGEPRDGASHLLVWQMLPEAAIEINGGYVTKASGLRTGIV